MRAKRPVCVYLFSPVFTGCSAMSPRQEGRHLSKLSRRSLSAAAEAVPLKKLPECC